MTDSNKESENILHNLWQKLWGEDIPNFDYNSTSDDFYEKIEQQKNHKRLKESLKVRRVLVCITLLICVYLLGCLSVFGYKHLVKTNEFFACLGKDVCTYETKRINYPSETLQYEKLNDNNIFIAHKIYNFPENYSKFRYFIKHNILRQNYYKYYGETIGKTTPNTSEIYNVKKNKFFKNPISPYQNNYDDIILNKNNCIVFYKNTHSKKDSLFFEEYNLKTKKYKLIPVDIDFSYYVLTKYQNNLLLINKDFSDKNIYLFDTCNYKLSILTNFELPIKYLPQKNDIKILKNGTLIIPIRYYDWEKSLDQRTKWDHIEIYNPQINKCIAFDSELLKGNLFYVEKNSNDVIFINEDKNYIFDKINNTYYETKKYADIQSSILFFINKEFGQNSLTEPIADLNKYIRISDKSFLVTCGAAANRSLDICSKTIYFSYNSQNDDFIVINEPINFYKPITLKNGKNIPITDYLLMNIGGLQYEKKFGQFYPAETRAEILKINFSR